MQHHFRISAIMLAAMLTASAAQAKHYLVTPLTSNGGGSAQPPGGSGGNTGGGNSGFDPIFPDGIPTVALDDALPPNTCPSSVVLKEPYMLNYRVGASIDFDFRNTLVGSAGGDCALAWTVELHELSAPLPAGAALSGTKLTWSNAQNTKGQQIVINVTADDGVELVTRPYYLSVAGDPVTIKDFDMHYFHSCMITQADRVLCLGMNYYNELGRPLSEDDFARPVPPIGSENLVAAKVVVGQEDSCLITPAGEPWCWGNNSSEQLSDTVGQTSSVVHTKGLTGIVDMALTSSMGCALWPDGVVKCWGFPYLGIGTGATGFTNVGAQDVIAADATQLRFKNLKGRGSSVCGLTTGDEVWCWGTNSFYQLGNGTKTSGVYATKYQAPGSIKSYDTNGYTTCVINTAGDAYCAGYNNNSQAGQDNSSTFVMTPTLVGVGQGMKSVHVNMSNLCFMSNDNRVYCMGSESSALHGKPQSGINTNISMSLNEVPFVGGVHPVRVEMGQQSMCAHMSDGTLQCVGWNQHYLLGNMGPNQQHIPSTVRY